MGQAEDRLARALIEANSRMKDLRVELQAERAKVKTVLQELDEAGAIDLERLANERQAEVGGSRKAARRELLR